MNIYLELNGAKAGPFGKDQVEVMFKNGTIQSDTLAWADGFSKWMPLQSIVAFDAVPPRSAPPPLPTTSAMHPVVRHFLPVGRVGRGTWFLRNVAYMFAVVLLFAPFSENQSAGAEMWALLLGITGLYLTLINASKRFHDLNVTAWLSPLVFVPLVPLLLLILSGTKGENRYGPAPRTSS